MAGGVPTIRVDLGTVDAGDMKDFRASIQADDQAKRLLGSDTTIRPNSNSMDLYWAGSGPGYMLLSGYTHHVANCDSFGTTASVMRDGKQAAMLDIKAKVRRAFQIQPITEGRRYALKIPHGVGLPSVVDHSEGIDAKVVLTGPESGELVVTRTKPALVPGGMIRLMDWKSRDSQVVMLPLPSVPASGWSVGSLEQRDGTMTIWANGGRASGMKDVEVVLDPPGMYKIRNRVCKDGELTLTLQSMTRTPSDLSVGFKRQGKWIEIDRYQVDSVQN